MAFVDYENRINIPGAPRASIAPTPLAAVPRVPDLANPVGREVPQASRSVAGVASDAVGQAMVGFGNELTAVAAKVYQGTQHTLATQALAGFLTDNSELRDQYVRDPDYQSAEKNYSDQVAQKRDEYLGTITDPDIRARTSLDMTRATISAQSAVRSAQLERQRQVNVSALDNLEQASYGQVQQAASPEEKLSVTTRYTGEVERLVNAGWIDRATADRRVDGFNKKLETADAVTLMQRDPARARALLSDPANFPTLDPVSRANMAVQAEQRDETLRIASIEQRAGFDRNAALAMAGRVDNLDHARSLYPAMIQIESGGRAGEVSNKGALGRGQLLLGTARDVAEILGMADVAKLSDTQLTARLTDPNDALNDQLGGAYWLQMVKRYDGNIPLAVAAYNAGPGNADKWQAKAQAAFGPGFTPAQLVSTIDFAETRNHVLKFYGQLGAPIDAAPSSPTGALRASRAVGSVIDQQQGRERQVASVIASSANAATPVAQMLQQGYDQDPAVVASWRAKQEAAATSGDTAAAGRLRDFDLAVQMQPVIRQAWAMPPAELDARVQNLQARMTAPGASPTADDQRLFSALDAVRAEQIKVRDNEPVALGGDRGGRFYSVQFLDPSAPLDETLQTALRARDAQAQLAHRVYGGSGSPFLKEEAKGWAARYEAATPDERGRILGTLATALSPQTFAAAMPQVIGKADHASAPMLRFTGGLYRDAPDVASSIVAGNANVEKFVPSKSAAKEAYTAEKTRGLPLEAFTKAARLSPTGPFAAMSDAIDARYAFLSAQAHDDSGQLNTQRLRQASDDVTGGVLSFNGGKVIAPWRGATQQQFDDAVWSFTDKDLEGMRTRSGKAIPADFLRGSSKLHAFGDGTYLVQLNRDDSNPLYAVKPDGAPYVLDLRNRPKGERAVPTDPRARINAPFVAGTTEFLSQ